jgi:hypothetical protein
LYCKDIRARRQVIQAVGVRSSSPAAVARFWLQRLLVQAQASLYYKC